MMHRIPRAILSGFSAGIAMLATFLAASGALHLIASPGSDAWNLVHNRLLDHAGANLYAAFEIHTLIALAFAVTYALVLEPHLTRFKPAERGALASLIPWLLSVGVFLPLAGAGFLGLGLHAGILPVVGNLVLHLVYGVTMAVIYDHAADQSLEPGPTNYDTDPVLLGGLKGLAGGLAVALLLSPLNIVPAAISSIQGFGPYWLGLFVTTLGVLWGVLTALPATPRIAR